ncbi:MAG: hypothetical protein PHH77_05290 [Victivallaceae bacterium]|nr:hypothetical protein [Victivallaceae bacterium]
MPGKIIGNAHWLLQPGYPTLSGEKGSEKITALYSCMRVLLGGSLPAYDSTFYLEGWDFFNAQEHLVLREREITPCEGGEVLLIKLVYSGVDAVGLEGDFDVYEEDPYYRGLEVNVPIELHPNHRMKWNHSYIYDEANGDGRDILTYWSDADDERIPDNLSGYVAWIKPDDSVPKGWACVKAATKLGVETYKISIPEVRKRTYSRSRAALLSKLNSDLKKSTPPDTFGYEGEWLQQASTLQKEGNYWVIEQGWLGSKDVDDDIYGS